MLPQATGRQTKRLRRSMALYPSQCILGSNGNRGADWTDPRQVMNLPWVPRSDVKKGQNRFLAAAAAVDNRLSYLVTRRMIPANRYFTPQTSFTSVAGPVIQVRRSGISAFFPGSGFMT